MSKKSKLNNNEIIALLDEMLEAEFSFIKTEQPAAVIAQLSRDEQEFILYRVKSVASTNIQLAHQFIEQAIAALDRLDQEVIEAWALFAMDVYDQKGLHPAMEVIRNVDQFIQKSHEQRVGAVYEEVSAVLSHFAHGLNGRQLKLASAEHAYTDTETIYLPQIVARLENSEANFKVYKAMLTFHWAQTRFGSFRYDIRLLAEKESDPQGFMQLMQCLEAIRLQAYIKRELPGLYRDMEIIAESLSPISYSSVWQPVLDKLRQPGASIDDCIRLTREHVDQLQPHAAFFFQGEINLEAIETVKTQRLLKEKAKLRTALRRVVDELNEDGINETIKGPPTKKFNIKKQQQPGEQESFDIELMLDDQPMPVPDDIKILSKSIIQDLGDIPDEYLTPAGDGEYDPKLFLDQEQDPEDVWKGTYHEEGAFLYNEWDYKRQHYRKNWCAVRELDITPVEDSFVRDTLQKHRDLLKHLRKTFEAMRDEDRLHKRQSFGDGIDIDALVEALADAKDGSEMSDRVFTRMHRSERNIAVCFMVDMSGSTKGWINDAERESLILLAETLETLGDRYAIYGFSGMARKRCEIFRIKTFDEDYNDVIKARISGIQPKDYTRMGFAIRHLSKILNDVEARTRMLITLSDGKPDDYDSYRGEYGIEDTRRALIEARRTGIHPYCITIDKEARDYLPHMYGPAGFTVIDEARKLPLKVSDIYRRLTR